MKQRIRWVPILLAVCGLGGVLSLPPEHEASAAPAVTKPTIVLVHGAFAGASSWNGVISILQGRGFDVVAAANPLRGVASDASYVSNLLSSISSPVVLVGHSYGGSVISQAAVGHANVKALVYVAAFAPDKGETAGGLSNKFPGSTLGAALAAPVPLADGKKDLYIQKDLFHDQFAADVPLATAKLMAATQRPITEGALGEPATSAAWRQVPSWFIFGDKDKNIPPRALSFMAERARSKETVVVPGASHVVMVSNPERVATVIEHAAATAEHRADSKGGATAKAEAPRRSAD